MPLSSRKAEKPRAADKADPHKAGPAPETRGDLTRARLVNAAVASVARYGLEGTTITRLMEQSGLSRGLISFHFEGKDRLLEAALDHAISRYEASWERAIILPAMTPRERLHAVVDHDLDFAEREPAILSLWWAAWGEAKSKIIYRRSSAARDQRFIDDLAGLFRQSGLHRRTAEQAALALNGVLLGFWLQHHLEGRSTPSKGMRSAGHALVDALLERPRRRG